MNIEVGPITTKKIIVLFLVIILAATLYLFFTRVDVHEIISPGPDPWIKQYTNRMNTTKFHNLLSTHIQEDYLIPIENLELGIQVISKDINVKPMKIKGFFISYMKNNDNILIKITEEDELSVLVMSENVNASHFQYFKCYDLSGNMSNGHYNITYYNELNQSQIVYIYHEENVYKSILKEYAISS